jgi:hypothetical protein
MSANLRAYIRQHHVALLALFVALGGTSYAAIRIPANSVGTRQIKRSAVTLTRINESARRALTGARAYGLVSAGAPSTRAPVATS